jgi:hypothetical protein
MSDPLGVLDRASKEVKRRTVLYWQWGAPPALDALIACSWELRESAVERHRWEDGSAKLADHPGRPPRPRFSDLHLRQRGEKVTLCGETVPPELSLEAAGLPPDLRAPLPSPPREGVPDDAPDRNLMALAIHCLYDEHCSACWESTR